MNPAKPTVLKLLDGNPGHKPINKCEPQPTGEVKCPDWISREAKKEWRRIEPELKRLGLVTVFDVNQLGIYCQCIADVARLTKEIEQEGFVLSAVNKQGETYQYKNKKVSQRTEASKLAHSLAQQFGFTPSSRSRLSVTPTAAPGGIREFISRHG